MFESLTLLIVKKTFERKCEAGTNFTKLPYVGKKENNPSLYFTRWHVKKSRKGETVSRYHPGRSLTYLEFENRITSISFAASLAPWEPFVSFWAPPSGFRARLAPNSIDCSSASLFVSSDGVYTRGKGTRYESYNGKAAALAFEIYWFKPFRLSPPPCIRVSRLPFPFTFFSLSARFFSPALFPPSSDVRPTILLLLLHLFGERWKIESSPSFLPFVLVAHDPVNRVQRWFLVKITVRPLCFFWTTPPSGGDLSERTFFWGTLESRGRAIRVLVETLDEKQMNVGGTLNYQVAVFFFLRSGEHSV